MTARLCLFVCVCVCVCLRRKMAADANTTTATLLQPKTTRFEDDYTVQEHIRFGTGANGDVVQCTSRSPDGRRYALKRFLCATDTKEASARREVDLHWRASDGCRRYIVRVVDVYENVGAGGHKKLSMVTEVMEGGELFDRIVRRYQSSQFTEREASKIMHRIGKAVQHLHAHGIAHRDIKPENLLYTSRADDADLKLADFGFAAETSRPLMTPVYTPYYAPPEVLEGGRGYDEACDLWSIGVVMYILLCGYPPFVSAIRGVHIDDAMRSNIREGKYTFPDRQWYSISDQAKNVIRNLLKPEPAERWSIEQLMSDPWMARETSVPITPLSTPQLIGEDQDVWMEEWKKQRQAMIVERKTVTILDLRKNEKYIRKLEKDAKP